MKVTKRRTRLQHTDERMAPVASISEANLRPESEIAASNGELVQVVNQRHIQIRRNILTPSAQLRMGVWNCNTLSRRAFGRDKDLIDDLRRHKIEIACLTEVRKTGSGVIRYQREGTNDYYLYYSGQATRAEYGVGLAVTLQAKNSMVGEEYVSDRIMTARFQQTAGFMTIVVVYAPTDCTKDVSKKDNFYDDLNQVMAKIPRHDLVIVAGDMNAEIGQNKVGWERVRGTFWLRNNE